MFLWITESISRRCQSQCLLIFYFLSVNIWIKVKRYIFSLFYANWTNQEWRVGWPCYPAGCCGLGNHDSFHPFYRSAVHTFITFMVYTNRKTHLFHQYNTWLGIFFLITIISKQLRCNFSPNLTVWLNYCFPKIFCLILVWSFCRIFWSHFWPHCR
jgi:hypothetical protein